MWLRMMLESILGSTLELIKLGRAEAFEKKFAGGRALSVRAMMARQMLLAHAHRKMKAHQQARLSREALPVYGGHSDHAE